MTTLTVTARGQVTFRRDVLQHLGIRPGEKIELDKLPDGRVGAQGGAARRRDRWLFGPARRQDPEGRDDRGDQ